MKAGVLALLVLGAGLTGCVDTVDQYFGFDPDQEYRNPGVFPGGYARSGGEGSSVLQGGPLKVGLPEVVLLRSDLPAYPTIGGEGLSDGQVNIPMAIWRPLNHTEPLPIIVDAGPYFEQWQHCPNGNQQPCSVPMENDTIDWPSQTTPFNLRNFVPHGYAVAQVAVRGTGTAGGCMDLMGPSEQHDLVQAIEYLASQPWSNGKVAMVGASYDGSTPWLVAASGTPALRTIVPTASLPDIYDLMFHNGTAETRGHIMHNQVYWGYGFDDEFPHPAASGVVGSANGREQYQDMHNLVCPEVAEGSALGVYSVATGERGAEHSDYWVERDYKQRILDNYNGSVFLVHGLQDWNVDPHAVIPFNQELRAAGIEMKEWYGQWGHAFPDSSCPKDPVPDYVVVPCRLDFAEVLLRWFDHHLKGRDGFDLGHDVQVQDNLGFWRNAPSFPDETATWETLYMSADGISATPGPEAVYTLYPEEFGMSAVIRLQGPVFEEDTRISGMPQVKIPFEATGGEIGVWLFDEDPRGMVRALAPGIDFIPPVVGHQQMNLRFYAGGEEPRQLMPGERYVAQVELEPMEVVIPAGNRLSAWIFQYRYPDHQMVMTASPVEVHLGGEAAQIRLPIARPDPATIFPVPGVTFLDRTYAPEMYVAPPPVEAALADLPEPPPRDGAHHADLDDASIETPLVTITP